MWKNINSFIVIKVFSDTKKNFVQFSPPPPPLPTQKLAARSLRIMQASAMIHRAATEIREAIQRTEHKMSWPSCSDLGVVRVQ